MRTSRPVDTRLPHPPASDFQSAVISKLSVRLVPFLFLLYAVAFLDRINVSFAALQMQEQLHFSDRVYGLGAGMFFAGYFFFQLPSNLVLERIGARRWMSLLLIVWGVISVLMMFVRTPRGFYVARFLLGSAEAGFFPGVILYLKYWFPASAQARAVAQFMAASPFSSVVGGPISGAIMSLSNVRGLAGWQWLFLLEGAPAVLLGAITFFYLTDKPEGARWLTAEQRTWLVETQRRESQLYSDKGQANAFAAFTNGAVWLLTVVYFGINASSYGIRLWLPNLIHSLSSVSTFSIGWISAIPYVVAAVGMVLVGVHSDRSAERRWHVAAPAFAGAVALLAAAYSASLVAALAAITIGVLAAFAMTGPFWAMSNTVLSGAAGAAGIALINSFGNLGGLFGPYMIGWVRTSSGTFRGGLLVIGASLALSGVVVLLVQRRASGARGAAPEEQPLLREEGR